LVIEEQNQLNEQKLVKKAKSDPEAFSKLYDLYFPKIFRYISWRVGDKNDAEDLVSEIFTKVLIKIDTFEWQKGATFSSWVFRIARNSLTDYYRTKKKRDYVNIDDLPEIEADEILPDGDYDRRQLFSRLFQMLQELPDRQAEIITMRFFTGMKNKEIAKVLEIEEKSAASSLCRGLQALHNKFNKQ